jgi:hypothetical protein
MRMAVFVDVALCGVSTYCLDGGGTSETSLNFILAVVRTWNFTRFRAYSIMGYVQWKNTGSKMFVFCCVAP